MTPRAKAVLASYARCVSDRTGRPYITSGRWFRWINGFVIHCLRKGKDPQRQIDRLLEAMTPQACQARFGLQYPPAEFLIYGTTVDFPDRVPGKTKKKFAPLDGDIHDLLNMGLISPLDPRIGDYAINLARLVPQVRKQVEARELAMS